MKQAFLAWTVLLCFCGSIQAQKERIKFSSINQFGILKGSSDQTYQLQTINGARYKTWFAGVGLGLENYYYKTIPLFIDLRKNLFLNKPSPFAYADLGISLPSDRQDKSDWQTSVYKTGLYYEAGIGYHIPLKGNWSFNFSAGYSYKSLHETRSGIIIWDFPPYDREYPKEYFDYGFKRLSLKAALQF